MPRGYLPGCLWWPIAFMFLAIHAVGVAFTAACLLAIWASQLIVLLGAGIFLIIVGVPAGPFMIAFKIRSHGRKVKADNFYNLNNQNGFHTL